MTHELHRGELGSTEKARMQAVVGLSLYAAKGSGISEDYESSTDNPDPLGHGGTNGGGCRETSEKPIGMAVLDERILKKLFS